jgi:hypothetical protein
VKKALAMATLAIELRPGSFQSATDQTEMKALLSEITESEVELEYYFVAARMAVAGKADEASLKAEPPDEVPRSATP